MMTTGSEGPVARVRAAWGTALVMALILTPGLQAQDAATQTYLLAAGCHFGVPAGEVEVLARWSIPPDEIPVGMFLATRAGVSPEVLFALRRTRTPWSDLALRYGLGGRAFHVDLGGAAPGGELSRAYGEYSARPPREWDAVTLTDTEVVALVNLRFLTEALGIPAARVLSARDAAGGWVAAYVSLDGPGC